MKFSSLSTFVSLVVSLSSVSVSVSAANNSGGGGYKAKRSVSSLVVPSTSSVGAAYLLSNEPSGNYVLAADIAADGTLTLSSATYAGGLGLNGVDPLNLPAPLFSQGSVAVSNAASLLAAVNAGSNTIQLFRISPLDPSTLTPIGAPVSSGGEFPISATFDSTGTRLCVLNGGAVNSVQCFDTTDSQRGPTPIQGSNKPLGVQQTTPPSGPAGSLSQVLFSANDQTLYVAAKGGSATTSAFVASWQVGADGSLSAQTRVGAPGIGNVPFAIANVATQPGALLVVDAFVGADVVDLSQNAAAVTAGNATHTAMIPNVGAACWVDYSPKTGSYYVSDLFTNQVTEIYLNGLYPNVAAQYFTQAEAGTSDLSIASVHGSDYMYVSLPNTTSIEVFSLAGRGKAQKVQTLEVSQPAASVGVKLTGLNLSGLTTYIKSGSA